MVQKLSGSRSGGLFPAMSTVGQRQCSPQSWAARLRMGDRLTAAAAQPGRCHPRVGWRCWPPSEVVARRVVGERLSPSANVTVQTPASCGGCKVPEVADREEAVTTFSPPRLTDVGAFLHFLLVVGRTFAGFAGAQDAAELALPSVIAFGRRPQSSGVRSGGLANTSGASRVRALGALAATLLSTTSVPAQVRAAVQPSPGTTARPGDRFHRSGERTGVRPLAGTAGCAGVGVGRGRVRILLGSRSWRMDIRGARAGLPGARKELADRCRSGPPSSA